MAARAAPSIFSGASRAGGACLAKITRSAASGESVRSLLGSDLSLANAAPIRKIAAQMNAKIGFSSASTSLRTKACACAGASACSRMAASAGVSGRTALVSGVRPSLAAVLAVETKPRLLHSVQIGKAAVLSSSWPSRAIPLRRLCTHNTKAAALSSSWPSRAIPLRRLCTHNTKAEGAAGSGLMGLLHRRYPVGRVPFGRFILICAIGGVLVWCLEPQAKIAESIDWTNALAFPEPVDASYNSLCGSCWAVASVQLVMAVYAIETGLARVFSCQQIIDHAVYKGCRGGHIPLAFDFMILFGLATEEDYPKSQIPGQGRMNVPVAVRLSEYKSIYPTERDFMIALQVAPIAVYLNVNDKFCQYRKGQILDINDCPPSSEKKGEGHTCVLVGYGETEDGIKYWKLMNTWGKRWGDGGFFYLRRDTSNPHGVAGITEFQAYQPVLAK